MTRTTPLCAGLASRLGLAIMRLARRMRRELDTPITPSQLSALSSIERFEPPTLGELAAAEQVQPPTMTRIVWALEQQGLARREVDPDDRRIARVHVTPEGRRLLDRSRTRRTAFLAGRLELLSSEDRATIEEAVSILERIVEDQT